MKRHHARDPHALPARHGHWVGFSDLKAIFLNGDLKRSPEIFHTQGLIDSSRASMEKHGVAVAVVRPLDPVPTALCRARAGPANGGGRPGGR